MLERRKTVQRNKSFERRKRHPCVERAMHQDCPVCFEYLFESRNDVIAMPCGHTRHGTCLEEMQEHDQYACPICSKSVCNMSKVWEKYDLEIAATPMPPHYADKMVWILCNDCGSNSEVKYHVIGQKCPDCKSYNTRQTRGNAPPSASDVQRKQMRFARITRRVKLTSTSLLP